MGTALDQQPGAHHRVARSRALRLCVFISELQATPLIPGRAPLSLPASLPWGPTGSSEQGARTQQGAEAAANPGAWRTWPVRPLWLEKFFFFFLITSPGQSARIARLTRRVLLPCVEPLVKCLGSTPPLGTGGWVLRDSRNRTLGQARGGGRGQGVGERAGCGRVRR